MHLRGEVAGHGERLGAREGDDVVGEDGRGEGEQKCGEMLAQWVEHYEGRDDRITLGALVESGLTIGEILSAMRSKDAEIYRLTSAWKAA